MGATHKVGSVLVALLLLIVRRVPLFCAAVRLLDKAIHCQIILRPSMAGDISMSGVRISEL